MDHDQRLKTLLREFFAEFFELFFPDWAARFDFTRVEFLTQEIFSDPPEGERRFVDIVAKLPVREAVASQRTGQEENWLALIHVEIEHADTVAPLRPRMLDYYHFLRRTHKLPVLPVALYLRVGLDGIGIDTFREDFWDLPILRFQYLYVGLPALPAEQHVGGDNKLGFALAAFMRIPQDRKAWLRAEALRRIDQLPDNAWRRFLLGECVLSYLPLEDHQQGDYERLLSTTPYQGARAMAVSIVDQAIERGMVEGKRTLVVKLLSKQFGPPSESVQQKLQPMTADELDAIAEAVLERKSLKELGLAD